MAQTAVILKDEEIAEDLPEPLRERVLSGTFFGPRHAAAERVASFAFLPPAEAFIDWFGPLAALHLATDPEDARTALDRDIAKLDALISAQLDAILHHQRLRRFEGGWARM